MIIKGEEERWQALHYYQHWVKILNHNLSLLMSLSGAGSGGPREPVPPSKIFYLYVTASSYK